MVVPAGRLGTDLLKSLIYRATQPIGMLPKVVVYNSVSVDGAINGFNIDLDLHYRVVGCIGADALLVGSQTAKSGLVLFQATVTAEEPSDFQKPVLEPDDERLLWVIPDSQGLLQGLLHMYRRSGFVKDIVVLVSTRTPKPYLTYLKQRNYDYIVAGCDHVDYKTALEVLYRRYGVETVVTDSGGVLASVLIEAELVDEVQLLVAPQVVGKNAISLFRSLNQPLKLCLICSEVISESFVLLYYRVLKS